MRRACCLRGVARARSFAAQGNQPNAVPVAELRAFGVALQDDELLAEEGIFGDEVGLAADHVTSGAGDQRIRVGSEPALNVVAELVAAGDAEHALLAPEI